MRAQLALAGELAAGELGEPVRELLRRGGRHGPPGLVDGIAILVARHDLQATDIHNELDLLLGGRREQVVRAAGAVVDEGFGRCVRRGFGRVDHGADTAQQPCYAAVVTAVERIG